MTKPIEAKPCPYCASPYITIGYVGQPWRELFAMCADCGAQGPVVEGQDFTTCAVLAYEKWNERK